MKFGILLTATIRPNVTSFTKRADPRDRERDYCSVIESLAHSKLPIVFCESSGYSLDHIREVLATRDPKTYELLSFTASFPIERGKGHGELQIIRYAFEHSELLSNCDFVVKITGRYLVENLNAIIEALDHAPPFIVCADYDAASRYTYSGFFVARNAFFLNELIPLEEWVDDSTGQHFEMALHRAISNVGGALRFPVVPRISGYSGTWNIKMQKGNYREIAFSLPKVRMLLRGYSHGIVRRFASLLVFRQKK